ncbi:oligomeric, coiled-coil, peripheral membrane protein, partial [Suhomyces tanzawaensis NRRL Y-17324]
DITYLVVYHAHSGHSTRIPKPVRYHSLAEFKAFLQQSFDIDNTDNLFLLTSFGIKLNYNLINELADVFIYDKRLFANDLQLHHPGDGGEAGITAPRMPAIDDDGATSISVKKMSSNLKVVQAWAKALLQDCLAAEEEARILTKRINVMFRALNLIFQFGTNFTNDIEKTFNNYLNHIKLINYKSLHQNWNEHYDKLKKFPVVQIKHHSVSLPSLLDERRLRTSSEYIESNLPKVILKFNSMSSIINSVNQDKIGIDKSIEASRNESVNTFKHINPQSHLDAIQKLCNQLSTDLEDLALNNIANLKSIYYLHVRENTKEIYDNASRLVAHLTNLQQFRNKLSQDSLSIFNRIANLQMRMVNIKTDLKTLTSPSETKESMSFQTINTIRELEDYLSLTIDLPLLFGFMLIEKRRQFEWYDFYSKGIVSNVSEQLSTIIEHEKLFRNIWLKKIGNFLNLLKDERIVSTLPSIDVTLVGNKNENFSVLYDIEIERSDIESYLDTLEASSAPKNFGELLRKNFKDLIKSTNNLKKVTALISSLSTYTSISNEEKLKIIQKGDGEEPDVDFGLVKELKLRIKKLENLLHQQQYKNITNWPVTRNNLSSTDNRISLILDPKKPVVPTPPKTDPTLLLQRRNTTGDSLGQSRALDTSGIDKHLDNIRLRKENGELDREIKRVGEENKRISRENERILVENKRVSSMESSHQDKIREYEDKLKKKEEEITAKKFDTRLESKNLESLNKKLESRDTKIMELQNHLAKFTELHTNSSYEINELNKNLNQLRSELKDSVDMKNDLLSNLSSKETEFTKERNNFESEIKNLQSKLEEKIEDYENLMELTQTKHKVNENLINDLNKLVANLFKNVHQLVENNFEFFLEFCFMLESMGLLLVKENQEYKITRVKGLRSKKGGEDNESRILNSDKPNSKVIEEIEKSKEWASKLAELPEPPISGSSDVVGIDHEDDKLSEHSAALLSLYDEIFNSEPSKLEEFLKVIAFKENVVMQEDSITSKFFLNAVSKRFRDVEGFAKRQTKENKAKDQEIHKLINRLNSKISMNDFHVNDLVLFLPTRIDVEGEESNPSSQPWAAFNIGAPHYFLNMESSKEMEKDWMVGRIKRINDHKVTEENFESEVDNPFKLSVGVVWYLVEATE